MSISSAIERAARIVWRHKVLAAMGILDIILTSSGLAGRAVGDLLAQFLFFTPALHDLIAPYAGYMPAPLVGVGQLGELYRLMSPYGTAGWIGLVGGVTLILIALAVIGLVIEGGVIAAVGDIEDGKSVSARRIFAAGWRRILPMVVIASVPAIPLTVGAALAVGIGTGMAQNVGGLDALGADPDLMRQILGGLSLTALAILCPLGVITLPLTLLSVLAYRACMLEALNAIGAFRRAWGLLRANPGPALILVAVSYGVSLLASAVGYLPNQLASLFLPAIAIVWLINGAARTYYLALWTLGWRMLAEKR